MVSSTAAADFYSFTTTLSMAWPLPFKTIASFDLENSRGNRFLTTFPFNKLLRFTQREMFIPTRAKGPFVLPVLAKKITNVHTVQPSKHWHRYFASYTFSLLALGYQLSIEFLVRAFAIVYTLGAS